MTASVYAIAFGTGRTLRFLKISEPEAPGETVGYRPFVWTADRERAELFSSAEKALDFAERTLNHDAFRVIPVPPTSRAPSPDGGTPVLMRVAA